MKSAINVLADYHDAPFERNVTVVCPEEYIQTQMKHLTRSFKKTESVEKIEKGDVVLLALQSELAKFNRPMVPLTVGGRLFDAELEEQLVGRCVGETFTAMVQDKAVTVTVKQASRTIFPEPTDEMAAAYAETHEGFEGVCTVNDYRNHVTEKYIEQEKQSIFYQTMDDILVYVLNHSDWNFDDDEIRQGVEDARREIAQGLQEEGKQLETLSADELRTFFDIGSLDEFEEMLTISTEQRIASDLWLMAVHNKGSIEQIDGDPWEFLENFVRESLTITEGK